MGREIISDPYSEKGYRIRCMNVLIDQIRQDHAHLTVLWSRLETGTSDKADMEDIMRLLSWLKQGLSAFKELRKRGIEGVMYPDTEHIHKDVKDKEAALIQCVRAPTRGGRDYTHLR